ncbi:Hypothetical protein Tpal_1704 [Trichococcus palustris]|uniref:HD/PDEase domain-containing protein n=1 Tax=Trichococcus palustris TaxID=140314 RepID=A0A143YM04_9LACT|nr:HD domain-containing protein [Trichococcus palustris]CZQ93907.1 Hypothetical protein Tpal_1704 [Trichococcus palustris]SFK82788.1 uncharacterized protein SAMN04488076_10617 [Trichococcus palustris]
MRNEIIIEDVKHLVAEKLRNESTGHDWWHTLRVYNTAMDIAKAEQQGNPFVIALAALLHDVADHKFGYTDDDREDIITTILTPFEVGDSVIQAVVYIVNNMSFKQGKNKHVLTSIEGQIVQDADRLDAIGNIGIARAFAYGGHKDRPLYNPDRTEGEEGDTISHFYEKLLQLKDKMNTETGKQKALIRHQRMEQFLQDFYDEWDGK